MRTLFSLAVAAALAGCAHDAWMNDESERISGAMNGARGGRVAPLAPDEEAAAEEEDTGPTDDDVDAELRGPRARKKTRRSSNGRWYVPRSCADLALTD